jgi:thiamine-phosphate pyrophosphorylase
MLGLDPIYPIVDAGGQVAEASALRVAEGFLEGGARVLQLRAKMLPDAAFLALALHLRSKTNGYGARLIINDRADIALLAQADGVHLGQTDLVPAQVRTWFPRPRLIGLSTHNLRQVGEAMADASVDYLGFGPIFSTQSKVNTDPVVGLLGLSEACQRFRGKPIVAIGGITRSRLVSIREAGASAAALISDLLIGDAFAAHTREARKIWGC